MSVNGVLNETVAHKIWYAWNHGNASQIDSNTYNTVQAQYGDRFEEWEQQVQNDEVDYDFELTEDEIKSARQEGKESAQESSGSDGEHNDTKSDASVGLSVGGAVASATAAVLTAKKVLCSTKSSGWVSLAGGIILSAIAAAIQKLNPNGKETEVLNTAKTQEYKAVQESLEQAQADAFEAAELANEKAEEADEINEAANDELADNEGVYSDSKDRYDELMEKIANGEGLTQDEKEELASLVEDMNAGIDSNDEIIDNTSGEVGALYDEIDGLNENFEEMQSEIEKDNGVLEFFGGFDEDTKDATKQVAIAQGVFAGSAFAAGALSVTLGIIKSVNPFTCIEGAAYYGGAAADFVAGGMAIKNVNTQNKYGEQVQEAINVRHDMEALSAESSSTVDQNFGEMNYSAEYVDELEMEVPEDMIVVEEEAGGDDGAGGPEGADGADVPGVPSPEGEGGKPNATSDTGDDDDKKVKKVDNDKKS